MRLTLPRHRFTLVLPALVVILLAVGAWATYPRASAESDARADRSAGLPEIGTAGDRSRSNQRSGVDGQSPSRLGFRRRCRSGPSWRSDAASTTRRRRCSNRRLPRNRKGKRRSRWALLHLQLGRAQEGSRLLTDVQRLTSSRSDAESLFRAARAAHALAEPETRTHSTARLPPATIRRSIQAGDCCSSKSISRPEALRSLQGCAEAAIPQWAPAHAGLARLLADENPPAAAAAATKALEIDGDLPTRT